MIVTLQRKLYSAKKPRVYRVTKRYFWGFQLARWHYNYETNDNYMLMLLMAISSMVNGSLLQSWVVKHHRRQDAVVRTRARLTIEWSRVRIQLAPLRNVGKFVQPSLPVSFGCDTIISWSLLPVSMPGDVNDPTQVVHV